MRQRLPLTVLALIALGLLCACTRPAFTASSAASSIAPPAAVNSTRPAPAVAPVRSFYLNYSAARKLGKRAAEAVVADYVAAWYAPILEAPDTQGADPIECGLQGPVADWSFASAGVLGGQEIVVIGSLPPGAPQELWIVATAVRGTGTITGITCGAGGANVTGTGARDAVTSFYRGYITARLEGVSAQDAITRLTLGGPAAASPYLGQVRYAITSQHLGYDPVTCMPASVPGVSARTTEVIAGSSVGVVAVAAHRTQFLVTVVLGAKGWTVGDIACARAA
jgi:hypothetical protein